MILNHELSCHLDRKEEDDSNIVFQKSGSFPNAAGISQGVPKWYNGELYKKLAPPWEIVKIDNEATVRRLYHEMVLSHLNSVHGLMTWRERCSCALELPGQFYHRRLVAEWLRQGIIFIIYLKSLWAD